MNNYKFFSIFLVFSFFNVGCDTVKEKTDSILDKENKNLSSFINKPEENLRISLGDPDFQTNSDVGYRLLFYKNKKFGITCTRRFEIDESGYVIGFTSKGCF